MNCIDRFEQFQQDVRRYPSKPYIDPILMPMIPITTNPPSNQQQSNPSKKGGLFKRIKKKKSSKENSSNNDMVVAPSNSIPSISTDPQDPYRMKEFFSTVPGLRSKIKKLSKLMDEYDQVYYQVLTAIDDKETNTLEILMENVLSVINRNSMEIKSDLDKMKLVNDQMTSLPELQSTGDYRMRELQFSDLTMEMTKAMARLQKIQKDHQFKSSQQIERQYKLIRPDATEKEMDALTDATGAMTLTSKEVFQLGNSSDAKGMLEAMRSRRQAIVGLERAISSLSKMFREMQTLVEEQGEVLNRIESNVDKMVEYLEEAHIEMETAVEHQKNIRKLKCSIF